jgi:hypothetical protein
MANVKDIIEDIADEDDEEEDELEEEHDHKDKPEKAGADTYIDFMSNGQDFALKIRGGDVAVCKKIFDELYHKIKRGSVPKPVKNDGAYH